VPVKPEVKAIASGLTDRFLPNAPMLAVDTVAIAPDQNNGMQAPSF
jgi:hypothetical protein